MDGDAFFKPVCIPDSDPVPVFSDDASHQESVDQNLDLSIRVDYVCGSHPDDDEAPILLTLAAQGSQTCSSFMIIRISS